MKRASAAWLFAAVLAGCPRPGPADAGSGSTSSSSSGGTADAGRPDGGGTHDAGSQDAGRDAGAPDAGGADAGPPALAFTPCPLLTGGSGTDAECALMDVPLYWERPDAGTIQVSIKRVLGEEPTRQLWLLQGGPGGSTLVFENLAAHFSSKGAGATVYMFEHRGVGGSTRLGCPQEAASADAGFGLTEEEIAPCLQAAVAEWGEDLKAFTTTAAARDLGHAIWRTSPGVTQRFVYGVSYGTYWAQRYLQVFPDQPTAVILDSICSPLQCHLPGGFAQNHDAIAEDLLQLCALNTTCAAKVGSDPLTMARGLFARIAGGHCSGAVPGVFTANEIKGVMASMLQNVDYRVMVPALLHRLDRCDTADIAALAAFKDLFRPNNMPGPADVAFSMVLYAVVARAELWDNPPLTSTTAQALLDTLIVGGVQPPDVLDAFSTLPTYTPDSYYGQMPNTSVPVLMLNGTLDPQTPPWAAQPLAAHLVGANQTYVEVDRAAHAIITQSRYEKDPLRTCGWDLIDQFTTAPTMALDTSCKSTVENITFANDPVLAQALLATGDIYDNLALPTPPPAPLVQRAREDFRRWWDSLPPWQRPDFH